MVHELNAEMTKAKSNPNSGLFFAIFIPVIIIVVVIGVLLYGEYIAHGNLYNQTRHVLRDSASEQVRTLNSIVASQYRTLDVIATSIVVRQDETSESVVSYLNSVVGKTMFFHLVMDYPDGSAYLNNGEKTNVKDRLYFQNSMKGNRSLEFISAGRIAANDSLLILSVPVERGSEVVGVLHGSLKTERMAPLLISEVYGTRGYSYICRDDGVLGCSAEKQVDSEIKAGHNLFDYLDNAMQDPGMIATLREDFANNRAGSIEYVVTGNRCIAAYIPVTIPGIEQTRWFLVNVVKSSVIDSEVASISRGNVYVMAVAMFLIGCIIVFLIARERRYSRKLTEELEEIEFREQQYHVALQQSEMKVLRYDIASRTLYRDTEDEFAQPNVIENVPDSVLNMLSEESREPYLEFFAKLCAGEPHATVTSLTRDAKGRWRWVYSKGTPLFDKNGKPVQLIVSYCDVTDKREKEIIYEKWKNELASMPANKAIVFECNLTRDITESVEGDYLRPLNETASARFDERTQIRSVMVDPDDRAAFLSLVNRKWLIGSFYDGKYTHSLEYRINRDGKGHRWVRMDIQLVQYPDIDDIKAYIVVNDIDEEKRSELALQSRAELDVMTGALNRAAFEKKVSEILENDWKRTHALVLVDVDHFKRINDVLGHQAGDRVLLSVVSKLRSLLREHDLIGRLGGDEFMVFMRDFAGDQIEDKAESICRRLFETLNSEIDVSVSLGAAIFPNDGNTFDLLYKCVDLAMYHAKEQGRNGFAIYNTQMGKTNGDKSAENKDDDNK